jgi:signal transduction histidine kinase
MVAFALVIMLLTVGMGLMMASTQRSMTMHLAQVHAAKDELKLVESLRLTGELLLSANRSYLISSDPPRFASVERTQADFDAAVRDLANAEQSPVDAALVAKIEKAARDFRRVQEQTVHERRPEGLVANIERFETEMRPKQAELRDALDRLVAHKTAMFDQADAAAMEQRSRKLRSLNAMLVGLVVVDLGVGWYFARKLAQTYRREAEALETSRKALIARDELMGIVAHDLRSPLGAITMKAEFLEQMTSDDNARTQAASINNIATRMAQLIKTMLDVTVIDAGQLSVVLERCDVDRLMRDTFDMFGTLAASKPVKLEPHLTDPGLVVRADRERVFQVLSNLLGNAIKFTPPGGRVTVSVERTGDVVRFAIADTGPGIRPEDVPHIFDRFWKHEMRGTKGTGLGLFIAKSIIDAHGGRIWVESGIGDGTTFYFTLPLATADTPRGAREAALG